MTNGEKGPTWGGAAEGWQETREQRDQQKREQEQERADAIRDIPILFGTNNFKELIEHLNLIEQAGRTSIPIGEDAEYPIKKIRIQLKLAIGKFSIPENYASVANGEFTDKKISDILGGPGIGITRAKISPESSEGFRGCIVECIKNMCKD